MMLILDSYGTYLRVQDGMFLVKMKEGPSELISLRRLKTVIMHEGTSASADALILAAQNDVKVILMDRLGRATGQFWSGKYGSVSTIRRNQLRFTDSMAGWQWAIDRVQRKIRNQQAFLWQLAYSFPEHMEEVARSEKVTTSVLESLGNEYTAPREGWEARTRGWEGTASRVYFRSLSKMLPKNYGFPDRSRRPAKDPFNCVLNYLYGMMYAFVEAGLIKAGIDPHIGVLHADQYNRPVMAFDFIEPYRIWAETLAFRLFTAYAFDHDSFEYHDGGLWLAGPGKKTAITAFKDYLEDPMPLKHSGIILKTRSGSDEQPSRKRSFHIELEARSLAQRLLNLP